jgi:TRAP transporter TAXI family solute receptor
MRWTSLALISIGALVLSAGGAGAQTVRLVLGTATPGGGFAAYGQALEESLRASDAGLSIELRATGGSVENIPALEAGKLDLALVEGTAAYEALMGIGRPPANLSVVAAMYPTPGMFVVRADSEHRTVEDLRGRRVVFGAANSGLVILARYVLDGLALDLRKDFDAVLLEKAADGPPMVLSGAADALWGGGSGWPGFEAVARGPHGARFIGLQPDELARVRARHPFLKQMTVPARSYLGQDRDIATVGSWSVILARPGLSEDAAYRFARALHLAQPALGQRLVQAQATTVDNTMAAAPRLEMLHPGVARYLRELGLL